MRRKREADGDGFEAWGGYMNAKITKLEEQFQQEAGSLDKDNKLSSIFQGVAIFVNGHSEPPAEVLRQIMLQHGGTFHDYQVPSTTHVIATNLPNAKLQQQAFARVLRPEWVVDSVAAGKLLPIAPYLLCARSALQPALKFQLSDEGKKAKTAVDASFINEFYNNSRLHHLSTMGALLKQYVATLKETHNGIFPGLVRLKAMAELNPEEGPPPRGERVIMHIDMDSFFVSVAIRDRPELAGKPVAVTHARGNPSHARPGADPAAERALYQARAGISDARFSSKAGETYEKFQSMSEIASCSYEARALGVRNGMYLGRALTLCPGLVTVPYDFAAYTEVSYALYETVAEYTLAVEAVSCDELFVDCTAVLRSAGSSAMMFTKSLRSDVTHRTRCPCSAGLGSNKLQARLASKKAKPNGQYHLKPTDVEVFMRSVPVKDLPGVGWSTARKLQEMNAETCMDLLPVSLPTMKALLGDKTGETLYRFCRGIDDRPVVTEHQRKSVSAEVNYGIRFTTKTEAEDFLRRLSGEVADRLSGLRLRGRYVTLKLLVRSADAPVETAKFLGHGVCDAASRSLMLPTSTADASVISDAVLKLYGQMSIAPEEMRGIGIQVSKLDGQAKVGTLQSFLAKQSKKSHKVKVKQTTEEEDGELEENIDQSKEVQDKISMLQVTAAKKPAKKVLPEFFAAKTRQREESRLPPMTELDPEVINALPEVIQKEILAQYGATTLPGLQSSSCEPPDLTNGTSQDSFSGPHVVAPPELTDADSLDSITSVPCRNLFAGLTHNELRTLISEWVEGEAAPLDCDVDMLAAHAAALVGERCIEELDVTMRCLWRCIRKYRKDVLAWLNAYRTVVDQVQISMVQFYRYPLLVFEL